MRRTGCRRPAVAGRTLPEPWRRPARSQAGGGGGGSIGAIALPRPDSLPGMALIAATCVAGSLAVLCVAWLMCKSCAGRRRRPPPPLPARSSSALELARMLPSR